MEAVGFGLGVVAEVRANVRSIQERITCYKEGAMRCEKVDGALMRVTRLAGCMRDLLESSRDRLPELIFDAFFETLHSVTASLVNAHHVLYVFMRVAENRGKRFVRG